MPAAAESPEQFDLALGDAHLGVDQARPVGDQAALAVEQLEGIEGAGAIVAARQPVGVALLVEGTLEVGTPLALAGIQRQGTLDLAQGAEHRSVEARQGGVALCRCAVQAASCAFPVGEAPAQQRAGRVGQRAAAAEAGEGHCGGFGADGEADARVQLGFGQRAPGEEHCTMAETHRLQIGSLRSDVALTLHTYHAARIWTGRQKSDAKHSILGLSGFCAYVNRMHRGAAQDDPYSDWWLVQIEEKVESCQAALKAIDQRLDDVMAKLPATLDISENLSVTPVKVPLFISNPLGFKAVYLLTNYDELARRILLAQHVGLVGRRDMEVWLDEGASVLRSLFGLAQSYQFTGATRDDFAANNARAEAARKMYEKFGEIPQDILEGSRRSNFAPPITRGRSDGDADDDADRVELED